MYPLVKESRNLPLKHFDAEFVNGPHPRIDHQNDVSIAIL